jgi:hypothetical protein
MLCDRCSAYATDAEEAMKQCRALLNEPNVDKAVRYGDIYGLMVEHYARVQQWKAVSLQVLQFSNCKCSSTVVSVQSY